MEQLSFKIQVFEGPLELLLHLIGKHKLNIYDIPILTLVEQYMYAIRQMKERDLEIASSFLEMAARLVYIKTASLLPVGNDAEELKRELTGELLEYRDCQLMAAKLSEQAKGFDYFARAPQTFERDLRYNRSHAPKEIYRAYLSAVGKGKRRLPPPISAFSEIVARKIVSVSSKIVFVMRKLWNGQKIRFNQLFETAGNRSEMVATFLAVLELTKAKRVSVEQDNEEISLTLLK